MLTLTTMLMPGGNCAARAQAVPDDCPVLGEVVSQAVLEAADGLKARLATGVGRNEWLECRQVALTVTQGFSAAMAGRDITVSWQWGKERGDLCLSGDLAQCHPRRNPVAPYSAADAAFVADSWHGVLGAVGKVMQHSTYSD